MAADSAPPYLATSKADRLFQAEILTDLRERRAVWTERKDGADQFALDVITHPYVVIVSQDCDLEQDAKSRAPGADDKALRGRLDHVLLVVASNFELLRFDGSDIKKQARQNKNERFHFLARVRPEDDALSKGLPSLVLDFKRCLSCPTDALLSAVSRDETQRRARLGTPYAEHLANRFAYFLQRLPLPRDHHDLDNDEKERAAKAAGVALPLPPGGRGEGGDRGGDRG